ncbi:unnamed protein product [Cyprideis torosa]|uniref:Uncharacterized protein n=1 Tax=Cyprideis torosa TaxID=163714 RepID=A0A7R8WGE9_9CRUS|nr:unnamed protein product [Cyprideis torosa]CAG0898098.1 unnamed protein product [Cyprideis torosa]
MDMELSSQEKEEQILQVKRELLDKGVICRTTLPAPAHEKKFAVWHILKDLVGFDLTKVALPAYLNEPLSFLQRMANVLEYSDYLTEAAHATDPIQRMESVIGFTMGMTVYSSIRNLKPFNPLLGETYEFACKEYRVHAEQVSHHPPVGALHCEGPDFSLWGTTSVSTHFRGNYVEFIPQGGWMLTLKLQEGDHRGNPEIYTFGNIGGAVHNLIIPGTDKSMIHVTRGGRMAVGHKTLFGISIEETTSETSIFTRITELLHMDLPSREKAGRSPGDQLKKSEVKGRDDKSFLGKRSKAKAAKEKGSSSPSAEVSGSSVTKFQLEKSVTVAPKKILSTSSSRRFSSKRATSVSTDEHSKIIWREKPRPANSATYYDFSFFSMCLNQPPSRPEGLCPTDSRLRPDIRAMENGDLALSQKFKLELEEKQRKRSTPLKPRWFHLNWHPILKENVWQCNGQFWKRKFQNSPDIFVEPPNWTPGFDPWQGTCEEGLCHYKKRKTFEAVAKATVVEDQQQGKKSQDSSRIKRAESAWTSEASSLSKDQDFLSIFSEKSLF